MTTVTKTEDKKQDNQYINRNDRVNNGKYSGKKIKMYNLDNECVATFKDIDMAHRLTGMLKSTLHMKAQAGTHGHIGLRLEVVTPKKRKSTKKSK